MNDQLDELFVNFFDCVRVALFKKRLKSKWNIIVVNVDNSRLILFEIPEVDYVFVVNSFENVDFFLQVHMLFLIFVVDLFLYEDFSARFKFLRQLAKRKLACFHVNDGVFIHMTLFWPASAS